MKLNERNRRENDVRREKKRRERKKERKRKSERTVYWKRWKGL